MRELRHDNPRSNDRQARHDHAAAAEAVAVGAGPDDARTLTGPAHGSPPTQAARDRRYARYGSFHVALCWTMVMFLAPSGTFTGTKV